MGERVDPRGGNIAILRQIPIRVEQRARIASLPGAILEIMHERIDSFSSNIGVLREVPLGVKQWIRIPSVRWPVAEIVDEWIDPCGGNIGVLRQVPFGVEQTRLVNQRPITRAYYSPCQPVLDFGQYRPKAKHHPNKQPSGQREQAHTSALLSGASVPIHPNASLGLF